MMEKYDAMSPGSMGGGGEYETQTGFGWTNGVALHFLQTYGWDASRSLVGSPLIKEVDLELKTPSELSTAG